jgi:hypothetical protein
MRQREGLEVCLRNLSLTATLLALTACASLNAKPTGPYGEVEAATSVPPIDMHRVVLQSIDGRNLASTARVAPTASLMIVDPGFVVNTAQSEFYLTPGEHTLNFTAVVNRRDTTTWLHPTLRFSPKGAGVLKLTVEAGKRYSVAARVDGAQPEEWEAVVYKVEDTKNYGR